MGVESIPANLLRYRKARGITQQQIAKDIGISRQAYSAIEAGKSVPKSGTLVAIAQAFGSSVPYILADPPSFSSLRFRSNKSMRKRDEAYRDILLHEFRRWLDDYAFLEELLGVSSSWEIEGVDENEPIRAAEAVRRKLDLQKEEPIDDIIGLLESAGTKIFTRNFGLPQLFGFSAGVADMGPAIAVDTSSDVTIERQVFTAAHELGHLVMHQGSYTRVTGEESEKEEVEANNFGSHFLLPQAAFERELDESSGLALVDFVLHVKRKFRISYKTVLVRLVKEYNQSESLYQRFYVAYKQKYGESLKGHVEPDPLQDPIAPREVAEPLTSHDFVESRLAGLVKQAYEQKFISASRAAEILRIPLDEMRGLETNWVAVDGRE